MKRFVAGTDRGQSTLLPPAATGRPAFHPWVVLKLYIYGHLNRVQLGRRLEREAGRNLELLWPLAVWRPITRRSLFSQGQW